jgi:hypothetical protein
MKMAIRLGILLGCLLLTGCEVVALLGAVGLLQTENDKSLQDALLARGGEWNLAHLHVIKRTDPTVPGSGGEEIIHSDETFEGGKVVFRDEVGDTGIRDGDWTFDDGTQWTFEWDGINTHPKKDMPGLLISFQGAGGRFDHADPVSELQTFSEEFVAFTLQTAPGTDIHDVEVELER